MKFKRNSLVKGLLFCIFLCAMCISSYFMLEDKTGNSNTDNIFKIIQENLKPSSVVAILNLTNYELNNTAHFRDTVIPIEGKLYKPLPPPPPYTNLSNYNVSIMVDGQLDNQFSATTDEYGEFQINYQIPLSLNITSSHKIQVDVTDNIVGDVKLLNYFIINVLARSNIQITNYEKSLKIPGERFQVEGFLRLDDGSPITNSYITPTWYNDTHTQIGQQIEPITTDIVDGSFIKDIVIPNNTVSDSINLRLSYSGGSNIGSSQTIIQSIILFTDIVCTWNIQGNQSENGNITINGIINSRTNTSLAISNRTFNLIYESTTIDTVITDSTGSFSVNYTIPRGTGNKTIQIQLVNSAGRLINSQVIIEIPAPPSPPDDNGDETPIPFVDFVIIFIPIVIGVVAALLVYGFFYYRKQNIKSKVVNLPLEGKIRNLKILKDTGRLEESLSYLFNAIYIDLINAKFGKTRKENETIRDFAIVSVKEFKLTPDTIYPFTQKIEEVIYAKPFLIYEDTFYQACELFSPIYFQLTGYNFILNF